MKIELIKEQNYFGILFKTDSGEPRTQINFEITEASSLVSELKRIVDQVICDPDFNLPEHPENSSWRDDGSEPGLH